jgi:hypothetical protein
MIRINCINSQGPRFPPNLCFLKYIRRQLSSRISQETTPCAAEMKSQRTQEAPALTWMEGTRRRKKNDALFRADSAKVGSLACFPSFDPRRNGLASLFLLPVAHTLVYGHRPPDFSGILDSRGPGKDRQERRRAEVTWPT